MLIEITEKAISEKKIESEASFTFLSKILQENDLQMSCFAPIGKISTFSCSKFQIHDFIDQESQISEKEKLILELLGEKTKLLREIESEDKQLLDFHMKEQEKAEKWKTRHEFGYISKLLHSLEEQTRSISQQKDELHRIHEAGPFSMMFEISRKSPNHFYTINGFYLSRFKKKFDPQIVSLIIF